jgi:hypothetical protein
MAAPQSHDVAMFESDTPSPSLFRVLLRSGTVRSLLGAERPSWEQPLASFVPSNSLVPLVKAHCALGLSGEGTDMWSRK